MNNIKIVFFGTSDFAANILLYLIEKGVTVCAVVTRPDKPRGRSSNLLPPPVKEELLKIHSSLPIYQPRKASTEEFSNILKKYEADLFVVVAYGEIIKENILNLPRLGCINVHASLLPAYRGAAPMQRALMDGVDKTGITIIEMVLEMDAGDMIETAELEVTQEMTLGELSEKLCRLACPLLFDVIENFKKEKILKTPQDRSKITFAPKILASEEEIFWNAPARKIHNQIRAFSPRPGAWCHVQVGNEIKRLKIKKSIFNLTLSGKPGETLILNKDEWVIACGEGAIKLLEVQLEGKKNMSIKDFLRGNSSPNIV